MEREVTAIIDVDKDDEKLCGKCPWYENAGNAHWCNMFEDYLDEGETADGRNDKAARSQACFENETKFRELQEKAKCQHSQ